MSLAHDPTNPFAARTERRVDLTPKPKPDAEQFILHDTVKKVGGDYTFEGEIVSVFRKKSGAIRYVVEDDRGVLHVYSAKNLAHL